MLIINARIIESAIILAADIPYFTISVISTAYPREELITTDYIQYFTG